MGAFQSKRAAEMSEASSNKRPRRQCVKCTACDRTGIEAAAQGKDPSNFLPTGQICDGDGACANPTFHRIHHDTVEYTRYGEPKLTSLIFSGNFDDALIRVKTYPKEASALGKDVKRESALHWAVYNGAPLELVRALLQVAPEMATYSPGWHEQGLPLEIALSRRYFFIPPYMLDMVRAFVDANKESASLALCTAFSKVARSTHDAAFDYEKYPDRIPADFGFAVEGSMKRKGCTSEEDILSDDEKNVTTLSAREQFRMMYDCFALLAKAAYYEGKSDLDGLPLTHALAAYPYWCKVDDLNWATLPSEALLIAFRLNPEELLLLDDQGNTPIHLAAGHREPIREKEQWELEMDDSIDIDYCLENKFYGLVYVLREGVEEEGRDGYDSFNSSHVEKLVKACPGALSLRNAVGDLPLHAAIRARKSACIVKRLVEAFEDATPQQSPGAINMRETIASYVEEHGEENAVLQPSTDMERNITRAFLEAEGDTALGLTSQQLCAHARQIFPFGFSADSFRETFDEMLEEEMIEISSGEGENCRYILQEDVLFGVTAGMEDLTRDLYKGKHLVSADKLELVSLLVKSYPEARNIRNESGKLPFQLFLHNKAQNHFDNVVRFMTEEAAAMADTETGLLGFMTAASLDDLDLSYGMLRAFPSVMAHLIGEG
ncbi:hypothetical protein ACHAXT_011705 [Thalassiosira profunda]